MGIIVVTPYALPELGANTLRVHSLADYCISKGLPVRVLALARDVYSQGIVTRYSNIFYLMTKIFLVLRNMFCLHLLQ